MLKNAVVIRDANIEDASEIARVQIASRLAAYKNIVPDLVLDKQSVKKEEMIWRKVLSEKPERVFVSIASKNRIVGFVGFGPSRSRENEGEIYAIYANPDYFRSGTERLLWEAARDQLVSSGFSTIMAFVITENAPSRKFYEGAGFRLVKGSAATFTWEGENLSEIRYEHINPNIENG